MTPLLTGQYVDESSLIPPVQYAAVRVVMVVPCYNEEKRLDTEAFRRFEVAGHEVSFLFVNDGSRDGTLSLLKSSSKRQPRLPSARGFGVNASAR